MTTGVTFQNLVDDTRNQLSATFRGEFNVLDTAINDTTSQAVTLRYDASNVQAGSVLMIGNETFYVLLVSGQTATCLRGFQGSTAETHSVGDLVEVEPRFTVSDIRRALRYEVAAWPNSLFRVVQTTVALSAQARSVDAVLSDQYEVQRLLAVYRDPNPLLTQPDGGNSYTSDTRPWVDARFERYKPTSAYPSGNAIVLNTMQLQYDTNLYVVYGCAMDASVATWATLSNDISTAGLTAHMADIPPLGAIAQLIAGKVVALSNEAATSARTRTAEQDAPALRAMAADYRARADKRRSDEIMRLQGQFPWAVS